MMHLVLYVMTLRFSWDVHVEISNTELGFMIKNLASGLEIKIEDCQYALPFDCYGSVGEGHPAPRAHGQSPRREKI